jgi:two-component system, LytTR family, sensor kinase
MSSFSSYSSPSKSNWYTSKWVKAAGHVSIWVIIILFPYIFNDEGSTSINPFRDLNALSNIFRAGIFYLNVEVLVPVLLYKKEIVIYILSLVILFCGMMFFHGAMWGVLYPQVKFHFVKSSAYNSVPFLLTVGIGIAYKIIDDRRRSEVLAKSRRNENLQSELSFLRSQVSPHFIFNVLNNIVALARIRSEELEPTVMKLSALMEYMLYETDNDKVPLRREIEYLRDYIDLQTQRFGDFIKMTTSIQIPEENWQIEPMLFIAFVENAFKHGVGLIEDPEIEIKLSLDHHVLYFSVRNKYAATAEEVKDKVSGIGLSNVARRLVLLYPNKHELVIRRDDSYFSVSLQLNLH